MLTELERVGLNAIVNSEYMDQSGEYVINYPIWTFSLYALEGRQRSGVVSSLAQKGYVGIGESDGDDIIWITEAGYQALNG